MDYVVAASGSGIELWRVCFMYLQTPGLGPKFLSHDTNTSPVSGLGASSGRQGPPAVLSLLCRMLQHPTKAPLNPTSKPLRKHQVETPLTLKPRNTASPNSLNRHRPDWCTQGAVHTDQAAVGAGGEMQDGSSVP